MKGRTLTLALVVLAATSGTATASIVTVDGTGTTITATCSDDCLGIATLIFDAHVGVATAIQPPFPVYVVEATLVPGRSCDYTIEMTAAGPGSLGIAGPIDLAYATVTPMLLPGDMGYSDEKAEVYDLNGDVQSASFVWLGDVFIPEPATLSMMVIGVAGLLRRRCMR